jgi:hypothetical protein
MAGKNTFKSGEHDSRKAFMIKEKAISENGWQSLESVAKYSFNQKQRDEINHEISMIVAGNYWTDQNANMQDIKRTLNSISKLTANDALEAVKNCDANTMAYLDLATWKEMNLKKLADAVSGDEVIEAAKIALNNLPQNKGGRPNASNLDSLAEYCCKLWQRTNHPQQKAWVSDTGVAPMVEFSAILFKELKNIDHDHYDLVRRLKHYI